MPLRTQIISRFYNCNEFLVYVDQVREVRLYFSMKGICRDAVTLVSLLSDAAVDSDMTEQDVVS